MNYLASPAARSLKKALLPTAAPRQALTALWACVLLYCSIDAKARLHRRSRSSPASSAG